MPDENVASPQPSPSPLTKGINWKTIIIGVVIGAILLGIGGFLVYNAYQPKKEEPTVTTTKKVTSSAKPATPSAQKDETADWKVYTHKADGIKFKYPQDWKEDNSGSDAIYFKGSSETGIEPDGAKIEYSGKVSYTTSLKDYIDKNTIDSKNFEGGQDSPGAIFDDISKTTLGGKTVYIGSGFSEDSKARRAFVDLGNGNAVDFLLFTKVGLATTKLDGFEKTFELVLSTVELVK